MSRDSLEQARIKLLRAMRKCAQCPHEAETSDGLVRHILESHRENGMRPHEAELLAVLQKEGAK